MTAPRRQRHELGTRAEHQKIFLEKDRFQNSGNPGCFSVPEVFQSRNSGNVCGKSSQRFFSQVKRTVMKWITTSHFPLCYATFDLSPYRLSELSPATS
jgi:hypothetical protein